MIPLRAIFLVFVTLFNGAECVRASDAMTERACDLVAAHPYDPSRPAEIPPTEFANINVDIALPLCKTAVLKNPQNARLNFQLGRVYDRAHEALKAKGAFEKAIELGHSEAITSLGVLHHEGNIGPAHSKAAQQLFETAASRGSIIGMVMLRDIYLEAAASGRDMTKIDRLSKALVEAYERAVAAESQRAMVDYGLFLEAGKAVQSDVQKARALYEKAAALGSLDGMTNLSRVLQAGGDQEAARAWREKAVRAGVCHLRSESVVAEKVLPVTVEINRTPEVIHTGDPLEVRWKLQKDLDRGCRTPLYLVLSTSSRTRFEGDNIIALPPESPAPFGIKYQFARTRVLVPLHIVGNQHSGSFRLKVYQNGPFQLDWTVVEIPQIADAPSKRNDFARGDERVAAVFELGDSLRVIGGNPAIVIRDRFTSETPQKVIRSNSGEFDLEIFDKFYRVLDAKTGELLQERNGWDPNFSRTSRFLGAFAEGAGFELIDLYSGAVILTEADMRRSNGFRGSVHLAAWSDGDAFVALSVWGWAGIALQQSIVDGALRSFTDTGCHACKGLNTKFVLDMEGTIAGWTVGGIEENGWESLIDSKIGVNGTRAEALRQKPAQPSDAPDEEKAVPDTQRQDLETSMEQSSFWLLADVAYASLTMGFQNIPNDAALSWDLGNSIRLSHHCSRTEDGCSAQTSDANAALVALRINHKRLAGNANKPKPRQAADARLATIRRSLNESFSTTAKRKRGDEALRQTVRDRLEQLGLRMNGPDTLKPAIRDVDFNLAFEHPDQVIGPIIESIPSASIHLPIREAGGDVDEEYSGREREASLIDPIWIRQLSNFKLGQETYWLIQCYYDMGATSRNFFALLHGSTSTRATMVDLASRLKFRVGSTASGLGPDGKLEETEERASTLGFGGWPRRVDKVTVAFERYLILSGHWLGANLRWVLLYDLKSDQILMFNRDVLAATNVADFGVTQDGRTLVQYNVGGQLYFYDVASGNLILRGSDIDDELIVYDSRGYYSASPEGAQFVFLKFPGLPGYNALQQFSQTLKRPDLIAARLAGAADTPDPRLTPPPTLKLSVEIAQSDGTRAAKVRASATSSVGLSKLKLYIDGRTIYDQDLRGNTDDIDILLPLKPEMRWISAVVTDTTGYDSVAQGSSLPGAGKASNSKLYVLAIGTDRYNDRRIPHLTLAKKDATSFVHAVKALKGGLYNDIDISSFLDASDLREILIAKLRKVAEAATNNDTIMLFAAGHGFRDRSTGQFYLATRNTELANLRQSSIAWDDVAGALSGTSARVLVLLDACHAGAADGGANDDAVSSLLKGGTQLTVLAAAKGRQESEEDADLGGGRFTTALVRAITVDRKAIDTNGNAAIELAELYAAIKRQVVKGSDGAQTPWIARNLLVGEVPLF